MATIKETKEVIAFAEILSCFVLERLSDGAGIDDAIALVQKALSDEEFQKAALAAWHDAGLITNELADLDAKEAEELSKLGIGFVFRLLAKIQG